MKKEQTTDVMIDDVTVAQAKQIKMLIQNTQKLAKISKKVRIFKPEPEPLFDDQLEDVGIALDDLHDVLDTVSVDEVMTLKQAQKQVTKLRTSSINLKKQLAIMNQAIAKLAAAVLAETMKQGKRGAA